MYRISLNGFFKVKHREYYIIHLKVIACLIKYGAEMQIFIAAVKMTRRTSGSRTEPTPTSVHRQLLFRYCLFKCRFHSVAPVTRKLQFLHARAPLTSSCFSNFVEKAAAGQSLT